MKPDAVARAERAVFLELGIVTPKWLELSLPWARSAPGLPVTYAVARLRRL